jgi:hypothetical protein
MAAIHDLLDDPVRMGQLQELAETGASIGTIEAKLEMPPGRLRLWLEKGKLKSRTPYRFLYMKFRSFAAEARATAEAQQLAKAPTSWLDRNTSARIVEDTDQSEGAAVPMIGHTAPINQLQLGANATLASLRILLESGVDLNEALRKNAVSIEDKSNETDD